ncbi:DUF559 domain-containing protein [Nonomuraea typhae]|uniref:DUF559 domain-containing protein n=1 Tax=Nonomuraea typhae TaxID=2603600 RepID=UPI0012F9C74F|nr:DUF559 domain-containing protein [Nonomuraea typhae]
MTDTLTRGPLLDRARLMTRLVQGAVACRRTAAHVWGLQAMPDGTPSTTWPVELAIPIHMDIPGSDTHELAIPPKDTTTHRGVRLTTPARTALDCARALPRIDAVTIIDQFLRRGVRLADLRADACAFDHLLKTLSMADGGAASPRESRLRVTFLEAGLPRPVTQIRVTLPASRHAYLDLGWPDYLLAVEYDGQNHHSTPDARAHDAARRTLLESLGWRVIPVRRDVVPARMGDLLEQVANTLIQRGWHPHPEVTTRILSRIRAARRRPGYRPPRRRT